jgi:hypothetical protein
MKKNDASSVEPEFLHQQIANAPTDPVPLPEIEHPGDDRLISKFGRELGQIVAPHDFFRRLNKCVHPMIDEQGEITLSEMDPQEFRTAIEAHCRPWRFRKVGRDKYQKVFRTIAPEDSRTTLVTVDFLESLRPVRALNRVRLPGFYKPGKIRLLPIGYCPEHRTYTSSNALVYPDDVSLESAIEFFTSLYSEFPFVGNRTQAVSISLASALTIYAAPLLPKNAIRPNFAAIANSEGAGKTLLWKISLIPVLGKAPAGTAPKDEDEMRKFIGATVLGSSPVFFLDNIKGHLSSPSLEALTTSPVTQFRYLGQSKVHEAEHGLTVFITGNRATFSPDLRRRTLTVELFVNEVRPESRPITQPLDDVRLTAMRPEILAALWALVRNWQQKGSPPPKQLHHAFGAWSKIVGGILEAAGLMSPVQQSAGGTTDGDTDLTDMESLVTHMNEETRYEFSQLVDLARHHHLFERILGESSGQDDEPLEPKARSTFGRLLRDRFTDRIFANNEGPVRFVQLSATAKKAYGIKPEKPSP